MQDLDKKITEIYNACWKSYRQYTVDHDMRAYNQRSEEIAHTYKSNFCTNILLAFAPIVNKMHGVYEMPLRR